MKTDSSPHTLDHTTSIEDEVVRTYDSNGAGLAVNDLDSDGDLDLVLANLAGRNAIFWNDGNFAFRKQEFPHGQSRAVSIIDIDGDGWLDIVFAHRTTRPLVWMNDGHAHGIGSEDIPAKQGDINHINGFTRLNWFSASQKAYTFAWADLDGDIDLDFVLATYQSEYTRKDPTDLANGGASSTMRTPEMTSSPPISPRNPRLSLSCSSISTRTAASTFGSGTTSCCPTRSGSGHRKAGRSRHPLPKPPRIR